jgi:hypothetical protein
MGGQNRSLQLACAPAGMSVAAPRAGRQRDAGSASRGYRTQRLCGQETGPLRQPDHAERRRTLSDAHVVLSAVGSEAPVSVEARSSGVVDEGHIARLIVSDRRREALLVIILKNVRIQWLCVLMSIEQDKAGPTRLLGTSRAGDAGSLVARRAEDGYLWRSDRGGVLWRARDIAIESCCSSSEYRA